MMQMMKLGAIINIFHIFKKVEEVMNRIRKTLYVNFIFSCLLVICKDKIKFYILTLCGKHRGEWVRKLFIKGLAAQLHKVYFTDSF